MAVHIHPNQIANPVPNGGSTNQLLAKNSAADGAFKWVTPGTYVPSAGATNQILAKNSAANGDLKWVSPGSYVPAGGAANQVLAKNSSANGDLKWVTPQSGGGGGITPYWSPWRPLKPAASGQSPIPGPFKARMRHLWNTPLFEFEFDWSPPATTAYALTTFIGAPDDFWDLWMDDAAIVGANIVETISFPISPVLTGGGGFNDSMNGFVRVSFAPLFENFEFIFKTGLAGNTDKHRAHVSRIFSVMYDD